jgi:DNA replication protein DnaC
MDWVHNADNVLLLGPSGTGKTHIASALGYALIEKSIRCKQFTAIALVQLLQQAKRDLELMKALTPNWINIE